MYHNLYFSTKHLDFTYFYIVSNLTYYRFYHFMLNLIFKRKLFFNFKTRKGLIGIWPKVFFRSTPLFDISDVEIYDYDNGFLYVSEIKKNFFKKNFFKIKTVLTKFNKIKNLVYLTSTHNYAPFISFNVRNFTKFFFRSSIFIIFFLRKQKCFNKGRYSRNRQMYRTGVY